ncbi:MAG TPA: hypothetical protein VF656_10525 [Pyrinomonadaceae bacterium]
MANWWFPLIRLAYAPLNYVVFFFVLLIPFALLLRGTQLKELGNVFVGCLVPAAGGSSLLAFFVLFGFVSVLSNGYDEGFAKIRSIEMKHYNVSIYRANHGAMSSVEVVVRQEKTLIPGLLLGRKVYAATATDAEVKPLDEDTIICSPKNMENNKHLQEEQVIVMKRFVYL